MSDKTKGKECREGERHTGVLVLGGVTLLDLSPEGGYRPPADVNETAENLSIRMELPGVSVRNVQVTVRGSRIEVAGEKPSEQPPADMSFLCLERSFGKFCRTFEVNGSVNLADLTAVLKNGILTLAIPKVSERRGCERRIRIETRE